MADENAQDVEAPEITPEAFDGEQESPKAESSTAENKDPEAVATKDEAPAEAEEAPKETESESEDADEPADADKPEDKPQKGAEDRKTQLNTEIRDLVAQRNALRTEVEKINAEVYQPATEQDLISEGLSPTDAKVEALRQQIEVRDYNEKVAEAQLTLESEAQRVINDFPIFNQDSEGYDEELAKEAAELMSQNLIYDENTGQIIGSKISPYQFYKTLARASGISATKAQIKGQQATEKMLANADTASSAAPAKKAADPLMELWKDPL